MCFSPEVSFGAAAVLMPTGVYCLRAANRRSPRLWPIALVPCVFGIQQAVEGVVWVGLRAGDGLLTTIAARVYLFFALAFWPVWFSVAAALIERPGRRRAFLCVWAVLSTVWVVVYLPALTGSDGRTAHVCHHSVRYHYPDAVFDGVSESVFRGAYLLTASVPLVISSSRRVMAIPVALGVGSAGLAVAVYEHAYTSVWCLFSAVLSASLAWVLRTAAVVRSAQPDAG
jgi:hypothetical protein